MVERDDTTPYGTNFRRAMARAGMKPADVVDATGASAQTVTNWRARGVSSKYAEQVAEFLGTTPEKISPRYRELHVLQSAAMKEQWSRAQAEKAAKIEAQDRIDRAERLLSEYKSVQADMEGERVEEVTRPHRPYSSAYEYRVQRLLETLQLAHLSPRDMDLIEAIIDRLSRRR